MPHTLFACKNQVHYYFNSYFCSNQLNVKKKHNYIHATMLKLGIYENIINKKTEQDIENTESQDYVCLREEMDGAEAPKILADYLAKLIQQKLKDTEDANDRLAIANRILSEYGLEPDESLINTSDLLTEVMTSHKHLLQTQSKSTSVRPESGFRVSNLFTGGNSTLSLGEEIRREIASADEIYFIVSFLKVSGLRLIMDDLRSFCEREGTKLHIITTTYCGVTETKAIKQLAELPNTEIRISYQAEVERLHAKAYIFVRHSGLSTAYIGSSNLSKSAQTDGLEWNIRVTNVENPHIIKTALATFEMYWNSPNFEDFRIGGIDKFCKELHRNKFKEKNTSMYQRFMILPHQKTILDKLKVEREEMHNYKNLIVAATGTGKTVISAFDYQQFLMQSRAENRKAKILFTAHREEILRQSLHTYRSVLQDANFGALWVGELTPECEKDYEQLFVSISMFNSRFDSLFSQFSADYYDYIVIDEAHHSQADSYRKLFEHFQPRVLVGLTATPERMDGKDLRPDFGGRISAEIRLPQALQAGLLTPFQYLCVSDDTDLSDDSLWNGQRYAIDKLADRLCSHERAERIIQALRNYLAEEYRCKALCFCVNKKHADFMAKELDVHGFKAASLTSDSAPSERQRLAKQLRTGELNYLCVVDIFNEGVDIPEIDTVLFLRPTDSLTIFLQQLGRGLRLSPGKTELTVLDFVAQANKKYDFASKFRALTLKPEKNIAKQIQEGFTLLPMGCSIMMEKKARQYILDNIQNAIYNKNRLIKEINSYTYLPTLSQFLENNGQDIRILYTNSLCWSSLKRAAGRVDYTVDAISKQLEKGMGNLIHYNTPSFLHFVMDFLQGGTLYRQPDYERYSIMLYYALFASAIQKTEFSTIYAALETLHQPQYRVFKEEMLEIIDYLMAHLKVTTTPLGNDVLPGIELYGCYTRSDIYSLVGKQTAEKKMQGQVAGVAAIDEYDATLLFVTLNKSDKDFSPSTQYDDYVINKDLFHWQSQNKDTHDNNSGKKYTMQPKNNNKIVLFVREEKKDAFGNTCPFHCFGLVDYVSSHGDAPMNITWHVKEPIMAEYLKIV